MATQTERRTETRRSIVASAIQLFDESGDTSASLDDIAALAGVAKSTVVYHFGSRLGLLQAVARRIFVEAQRALTSPPTEPIAWIAALLRSQTDARARVLHAIDDELTSAAALGDADPAPWIAGELQRLGLTEPEITALAVIQVGRRLARGLLPIDEIDDLAERLVRRTDPGH